MLTLNLLRASRINPKLSAYAAVFGQYSYNHTPIAPPGTHVLVHEKPDNHNSWAPHAVDAWYVGPALKHYRGYRTYVWETKSERISDTVTWLPKNVALPQLTPTESIIQSTEQITEALAKLYAINPSESLTQDDDHIKALQNFQAIMHTIPSITTTDTVLRVVVPPEPETNPAHTKSNLPHN